ncbi:hypothetical protein CKAH01_16186 [Colletotrichum kahawae]|uniref:Uncharacterized protein n=1 Tax=Colletotrichum kahawae TaxID=34407 RepID=A0AAD9YIE7_COLKA|nr:hypothetical protein CKAH01_16186 [Colletotrichum kahawae]
MSRDSSSNELRPFTEEDGRNASLQAEIPPTLPTPKKPVRHNFWLTKSAPITFALIFIACASALVGLSRYISRQNGLPLSITSIHYSWTYGPTAILVIILAGWKQADYQYKSMQPWWELVKGPSPASRSVLLDYLSPFQPLSCFEAFKNGHYVVAISVLNYFILKIIILISTTLFVVQPTLYKEPIMIHYDNRFDIENMQKKIGYSIPESWVEWIGPNSSAEADVPVWSYLAEINSVTAANAGTVNQSIPTHQSFTLPSITSNMSSASAPVNIFIPTVTCEEASLSYSETDGTMNYHLNSSTCLAKNVEAITGGCEDNETPCASTAVFTVQVVYVAARSNEGSLVLCDIRYGMVTTTASHHLPDRQIMLPDSLSLSDSPRHMPNMTDRDLTYILYTSLDRASQSLMITSDVPNIRQGFFTAGSHAFLQLVATNRKWTGDLKSLQQPSLMIEISTEILMGMSKAFAQTVLLGQNSQQEPSEATAMISENRLHIRSYSLWPMVAWSIASHATVLATSPSMLSTLRNAGHYRTSQLKARLGDMLFTAAISDRGLSVQALGSGCINPQSSLRPRERSWIPLSARLPMVALLFLLPLLLIAILELLQRLSENHHGFFNLANRHREFPATVTYEGNPEDIHLGDVRFHPEKSRAIHNEMNNGTSFNFRPLIWFDSLAWIPLTYDPDHFHKDYFFDHLMFGPDSLPLEDLVGPENIQNLTNAVSHNYREFMAHVLDHNFRSEIWTPINGVSWQMTTRISIHQTSKVVLQALLAAMTVLGLIGYKLVKLRGTLPRNPCSIASTMGFLADSQLCDPDAGIIPADAGTTSERELGQSLGGYVFSLGWWEEVGDKSKNTTASPRDGELGEPGVVGESEVSRRRHFGIDVGQAYALGFAGKDKE